MLSFKLSEEFVDSYRSKPEKFGFNGLGNIVFYRTYSRVKENGEYETWADVCARVINGMYSLLQDHSRKNKRRWDADKAQKDAQEAFDRMFNFKWTPSGRGLWMMGTPFIHERKTSEALLNCAFIGTENIKQEGGEIFEWIANMLMLGVGVAFDTKGAGEVLVSSPRNSTSTYLVDDSREGWARSIKVLVNSYLDGTDVALFDYSMVRKKGEPIKGFGGVASGPEPLMLCHDRIREYMNKNVGKKITSRTITDICNAIGACVVAGNVRRSAELALGEADDQDYIALKNYSLEENKYRQEIGWASNNSIIGDGVKQYGAIAENIRNNGEPGVVWLENIERYGRMGEEKHDNAIGVNPCQPGFATVLTPNGIRTFNDISIGDTIWSGKQWTKITNKQYTGVKDVLVYSTNAGEFIGTENHRVVQNGAKIEVKDAQEIDLAYGNVESIDLLNWQDVMDGMVIGDGMVHKASNKVVLIIGDNDYDYFEYKSISSLITKERKGISTKAWEVKTTITADELPHTYERTVPDRFFYGDKYVVAGFLKGLFTANGCVNGYGKRIELKQTSLKLIRQVQQMLSSLGIRSYITTTKETRVVHKNGEYVSKKSYALSISVDRYKFAKLVGFVQDYKTFAVTGETAAAKNTYEINKVTNLGKMPVYDITVEADEHTYWTGGLLVSNCSEIPLASREMCVSGDTYIQTRTNGVAKIKDLIGIPVEIWNGEKWANVTPFETGKNALYRITLSDGSYLDATPNHKWLAKTQTQANMRELMTKELSVGMKLPSFSLGKSEGIFDDNAYAYGWFAGDGFMDDGTPMAVVQESEYFIAEDNNWKTYKAQHPEGYNAPFKRVTFNGVLNPENCKQLRNKTDGLPKHIMSYDNDSIANFIGGWIDADGHLAKQTNTDNYILYGTEQKIRDAQLLLRRIGIDHASIQLYAKKGEKTNFGIRNYDLWKIYIPSFECEAIKTQLKKATRFGSRIGANPRYSGVKIDHARTQKIIRIEKIADSEQTYCFFEPEKNMGVFGNVITKQCNLSEIYMQNMDDEYDFQRTIKFAYLYSKAITLTYEWITDSKSRKIMMKNRRVGVGTTAIAQFLGKHSVEDLVGWWDRGYKLIQSYDDRYSQWLGIPKSIRTTTIKPSGTVSLLAGATPGIHYPHDNFYIRRVRIQDDTPMLTALQYAGYKIEKDVYSANTSVIEIPIKVEGETSKNKTLWEQLQLASLAQRYWSDNSVSVTISFKPSDVTSDEIANAISLYAGELKCVSMLPITEEGQYEQMPYESITKEKYEEMIRDITPIANLAEHMSIVNKMKDLYCENDSCVIK